MTHVTKRAGTMNALYSLYDALVSISVPSERARAVVDAMERDMTAILATKSDLTATQLLLKKDIDGARDSLKADIVSVRNSLEQKIDGNRATLEHKIELLRSSMTIRLGSMQFVGIGLLFAALKLT
jgi:hypothetical protein